MITLNPETQLGTLIENQFGDHYLFSVNRQNFDKIDYQTKFLQDFDNIFDQEDTLYIITGTDSGMMVKQLLKTPPEKGSAYVFIEFPEIIRLTKDQYDLAEHKRIIVTTEEQWQEDTKKIGLDIYFTLNKVNHIRSFATQYYHLSEYLFLRQAIEDEINHLTWQFQSQLQSKTFIQKQLENVAENHTPAILLKDYFKGKSALILAGGPSLDNYIDWIEENQEYYIVIAVTRIARRLLQTKIKPDIFVSVDPNPVNFNVSKEVFNYEKDSLLVHQYHLSPMLLGNWLGINLYLGDVFPWETKLNINNLTGIGPTVTNTSILFAINMGIKKQILFGVDLCYSPEGYTHAEGSSEHDAGPDINSIGQTVITNKGEKAETNSAYYEAITTIESLAELAKESGGSLCNPSPDSARMINVEHTLIDKIKINNEPIGISKFLQEQFQHHEESDFKIKHYQEVLKELKKAQFNVDKIEELANQGLKYNENFFDGDDPTANFKFKLKMDKLEKELNNKNLSIFTDLSKKFGIKEFLYFLNPDSDREWTDEEIKKSGDTYYKALRTGAIELGRHIFTAVNRTEIRLLENAQLKIDNELIKRHLCSFDKSYLLDRQIKNQESNINKNINKLDQAQKEQQQKHLENLKKNKQETIKNCKNLYSIFQNNEISLGKSDDERIQVISFYLLMLQNEENYQTRRLFISAKENSELIFLPENISILDEMPASYIQKHKSANSTIQLQSEEGELIKLQNQIANVAENHTPASVLKDYFMGKSALILSDKIAILEYSEWIEEHQDHFIIIALSHLAKELLTTEIKPDVFIATRPEERSFEDNKLIVHFEEHSILINQNHLLPKILGNWLGVNLYLGELFPWNSQLNIENLGNTEKNNTDTALSISAYMGIKESIIFSSNMSDKKQLAKIQIPTENTGISNFLHQQSAKQNQGNYLTSHYKKILEELNKVQTKLENIDDELKQKQISNLINLSEKFNIYNFIKQNEATKNINLENKFIKSGANELSRHIYTAINRTEIRILEQTHLNVDENLINRNLASFKQTTILDNQPNRQIIATNIKKVMQAYQTNDKSLGCSKEKRKQFLTLFLILKYNSLNQQQRRLQILEKNKEIFFYLSENIIFHDIKASLMLNNQKRFFNITFGFSTNIELEGLEVKLYNLFILKDNTSIKRIIKGIRLNISNEDNTEPNSYFHLAQGYSYELNNQLDKAIEEYGQAAHSKTIESALKRIAFIALEKGDIEYAHNALQILSEISPLYLPQLAELYNLTNNYKDALDTYTQYLDYCSSDIAILLKIGELYENQEIQDGIQFIYQHILELEPNNQIAKKQLRKLSKLNN